MSSHVTTWTQYFMTSYCIHVVYFKHYIQQIAKDTMMFTIGQKSIALSTLVVFKTQKLSWMQSTWRNYFNPKYLPIGYISQIDHGSLYMDIKTLIVVIATFG